jgi:GMP synthase-like glutamine amidotransferase
MKIGLLVCAKVSDSLAHLSGSIADMYRNLFNRHAPEIELEIYDVINSNLPDVTGSLSGYLFTGSPSSVYDEDQEWIIALKKFVQAAYQHKKKMVGVCFGHQLIAEALGGSVACSSKGWGIGVQEVDIHHTRDWMIPRAEKFNMLVSYQDQVTTLPSGGALLAGNSHCRYFMFDIQNVALGIQGHPEFDIRYAEALYESRRELFDQDVFSKAMASLKKTVHPNIFAEWICHFFKN